MLSLEDQKNVSISVQSRLAEHFDNGEIFGDHDWLGEGGGWGGAGMAGGKDCSIDPESAASWIMRGVSNTHRSLISG